MGVDRTASIKHNDFLINSATLAWAGLKHSHFVVDIVVYETLAIDVGLGRCLLLDKFTPSFSLMLVQ